MSYPPSRVGACLLLVASLSACFRSASPSKDADSEAMARIAEWEDRRSLGEGQLLTWARGEWGAKVQVRALRALARIQDAATLEVILASLAAREPEVRDEAAFAAGELALSWEPLPDEMKARLTEALRAAEVTESDGQVRRTLLESFSKVTTPGAVQRLIELLGDTREGVAGRAALALGVAARRGASLADVPVEKVGALLAATQSQETRYGATYLLAYVRRPAALELLRQCVSDASPEVRAICAKGFPDVAGQEDANVLGRLLEDPMARVAAEAARSLAKLSGSCSGPCATLEALRGLKRQASAVAAGNSAAGHALLAVAQQGLPPSGRPVFEELRRSLREASRGASEVALDDVAWLDCRLAAAMDRQTGALAEVLRCGNERIPEARRLALGLREVAQTTGQGGAKDAVAWLNHPDARVRMAALDALSSRPVPEALESVRALMKGEDPVVAAAAALVAGKMKALEALPEVQALVARVPHETDLAEPVGGALVALVGKEAEPVLRTWLVHSHANVRRVAAELLTGLTGQPVRSARVELPVGAFRASDAPDGAKLTFRTRKGDFSVALDSREAPVTSGNLYALARKGYFRDITFHRVVPDFVAQGGDPRGDGEGGPGYSIRCEVTRIPYERGVIGMALSGKDTGGSQFFFTHTPQPHLDGRYTAFGRVVSGMEVVDALLEGDVILEVRAEP
ncbi:peptidylprolyl isomerase [Hyalangium versicolor]|uniref:peptidylprolyl isomerase n=1 Tax=Hyalangium versicolor TaxID=2861190 RepID=UPI001CCA7E20|nr:peptidylprolyl isomerase [Hyalangium versicolor]